MILCKRVFVSFSITLLIFSPVINRTIIAETQKLTQNVLDLVIADANVITMEPNDISYTSILVDNGIIIDVTSSELAEKATERISLEGRTILPGFIDSHSHWIDRAIDQSLHENFNLTSSDIIEIALSHGWTTVSEQAVYPDLLAAMIELDEENQLILRVNGYLLLNYEEQLFNEWYKAYQPNQIINERIRIAGVKLLMDNRFEPVRIHWLTPDQLNPIVQTAHNLGFQISVHSIWHNATDKVLDALEIAQGDNSNGVFRHKIEHASFLRDDQLTRINQMNTIISTQLQWYSSDWTENIYTIGEATQIENLQLLIARWRDVIDEGITFIGGTDILWEDPTETGSSILGLYRATTRIGELGITPSLFMQDQRISIEEALKSITIDAAYGVFQEDVKGSIKPGKLADFVVLSENPILMDPEDLLNLQVDMTIIGGEVVYCREGQENICTLVPITNSFETQTIVTSDNSTNNPYHALIALILMPLIYRKRKN